MERYYGISDLTDAEVLAIKETKTGSMNYTVGPMLSARANIGWTSGGHTGEDVTLFSYLPGGNCLSGTIENTDIARIAAAVWGTDLGKLTSQLYVNANETFKAKGAAVTVEKSDPENMALVVKAKDKTLSIPESKNFVLVNGGRVETGHVTVQTNGVFYVPQAVIDLMK
jgi:alkaline phosphatase